MSDRRRRRSYEPVIVVVHEDDRCHFCGQFFPSGLCRCYDHTGRSGYARWLAATEEGRLTERPTRPPEERPAK